MDIGAFISAVIYFVIFMAIIYFVIVVPYKHIQARRGQVVFGDPAPVKTCPACLSSDLPAAASKCKYCGTDQPASPPEKESGGEEDGTGQAALVTGSASGIGRAAALRLARAGTTWRSTTAGPRTPPADAGRAGPPGRAPPGAARRA